MRASNYLSVPEVAKLLDASDLTIYKAIKDGRFRTAIMLPQPGKRAAWQIAESEVSDYIRNDNFFLPRGKRSRKNVKFPNKIFISTPMAGKPDCMIIDTIEQTAKEGIYPTENYISGYMTEQPPKKYKHPELWYLGKSLMRMADCEEAVFTEGWEKARGCVIERLVYDFYFRGLHADMIGDILMAENNARTAQRKKGGKKKHG